jgi:DNA repair protein RadA/Sms
VAGGVKIDEPAADLGILTALASSHLNKTVPRRTVVFGEIGLAGEVRAVSQPELRVSEAARLGFERCLLPASNCAAIEAPAHLTLCPVRTAQEALDLLFNS